MFSNFSHKANHSKAVEKNLSAALLRDVYRDQNSDPSENIGMRGSRVTSD